MCEISEISSLTVSLYVMADKKSLLLKPCAVRHTCAYQENYVHTKQNVSESKLLRLL